MDDRTRNDDVGRTSGGGNLGHKPTRDVAEQTPIKNQGEDRDAAEPESDPVMPSNDSTLNTKI